MATWQERLRSELKRTEKLGYAKSATAVPRQAIGAIGGPPLRHAARSRSRSRGGKGKGGSRGKAIGGQTGPREDGDLDHGRLLRLLKLIQRNEKMTPPKEVYTRWNDYCDRHSPRSNGRPIRDPKLVDPALIRRFLASELPAGFWTSLIKKIQGSPESGFSDDWANYCDSKAPQSGNRRVRDPGKLPPEFLFGFIATVLEGEHPTGQLASIIDDYSFDFLGVSSAPSVGQAAQQSQQPKPFATKPASPPPSKRAPAPKRNSPRRSPPRPAIIGAIGALPPATGSTSVVPRHRREDWQRSKSSPPRDSAYISNGRGVLTHGMLLRLLKLIQRNAGSIPPKAVVNKWNEFCDVNSFSRYKGAPPIRDPKDVSKELILRFFVEELPINFWVFLVKKIQAEGRASQLAKAWEGYCDQYAPPMQGGSVPTRDPRKLDAEFMLEFVCAELVHDNEQGGQLAQIVDAYQFDFTREHKDDMRDEQPAPRGGQHDDGKGSKGGGAGGVIGARRSSLRAGMPIGSIPNGSESARRIGRRVDVPVRGTSNDSESVRHSGRRVDSPIGGTSDGSESARRGGRRAVTPISGTSDGSESARRGGRQVDRSVGGTSDGSDNAARVVRLLQRASDVVKRCWDAYCDVNAPLLKGVAIRDPRKHTQDFIVDFLSQAVPVSAWCDAIQQVLDEVPEFGSWWEEIADEMAAGGRSLDDSIETGIIFLFGALQEHEKVADVIGELAQHVDDSFLDYIDGGSDEHYDPEAAG